jgi:hypothetical protein
MGRPRCTPAGPDEEPAGDPWGAAAARGGGAGAEYTGRGPVCGMMTRRMGAPWVTISAAAISGTASLGSGEAGTGWGGGTGTPGVMVDAMGGAMTICCDGGVTGGRATTGDAGALAATAERSWLAG